MVTDLDPLRIRQRLGRKEFRVPREISPGMWAFEPTEGPEGLLVLVTVDEEIAGWPRGEGVSWIHASCSRRRAVPSYADLTHVHRAVFGDGWAYHLFAPPAEHIDGSQAISIPGTGRSMFCLHLFGRLDGKPVLPDFTRGTGHI
jgi:hypothetical protein